MVTPARKVGRTKIVCTIGPASHTANILRRLIAAGMDVARLNFSYGTHQQHLFVLQRVRRIADRAGQPVAILQDLSGPKIRLGEIENGECTIHRGASLTLTARNLLGNSEIISINLSSLPPDLKPGDPVLINDGAVRLRVADVRGRDMVCKVLAGGKLTSRKGINLPNTTFRLPSLTPKDVADLRFAIQNDVDFVGLSFVRKPSDIKQLRKVIAAAGKDIPVIAKIEKRAALDNLEGIVKQADGVMVARGDLGVETDLETVPLVQKRIISLCNRMGKPVITATQMLESMVLNPTPTRAEVTDIANAIIDGTDAVMLSEETAVGEHPLGAVQMMSRIAIETERHMPHLDCGKIVSGARKSEVPDAIAHAAAAMVRDIAAKAIVACTMSGGTARLIARYRPPVPVLAASPLLSTVRRLCLTWGVFPVLVERSERSEDAVSAAVRAFLSRRLLRKGDRVVVVAGISPERPEGTNMLRVVEI
jgi:pyruvate kinase